MKRKIVIMLCVAVILSGCGQKADETAQNVQQESEVSESQEETEEAAENEAPADGDQAESDGSQSDNTEESEESKEADEAEEETAAEDGSDDTDYSARDLFADFIMGKGDAKAADDLLWAMGMVDRSSLGSESFTVSELEEKIEENEIFDGTGREVSYAPLMCHGELFHVMKILYKQNAEEFTDYFIFMQKGDTLELKFAIDSWTRRWVTINEEGVVFDEGSNGAGSHSSVIYAPDKNVTYHTVSDVDEEYYGYSFYDEEGNPVEALNATMQEAGDGNDKAKTVAYYREVIDGKVYYYFLGGTEKIVQSTVEYIDKIAASHKFTFDGKAAADEARKAYEEKLDIVSEVDSQSAPYWKDL